jgi:HSP20 family protein
MASLTPERMRGGLFARDPFRNFEAMRQMMDPMFDTKLLPEFGTEFEPAVNLYESDGAYTLECAVPGYSKDDIKVDARADRVTIAGSYSHEKSNRRNHYHRMEIRQGSFVRTVVLPQEIDTERIAAKLENGLLTIRLRPTKAIESKSVPVTG